MTINLTKIATTEVGAIGITVEEDGSRCLITIQARGTGLSISANDWFKTVDAVDECLKKLGLK
jgi:hypothetical protein